MACFGVHKRIVLWVTVVAMDQCMRVGTPLQCIFGIAMIVFSSLNLAGQCDTAVIVCVIAFVCALCGTTDFWVRRCESVMGCVARCLCEACGSAAVAGTGIMYAICDSAPREAAILERLLACMVGPTGAALLGGSSVLRLMIAFGVSCALFAGAQPLPRDISVAQTHQRGGQQIEVKTERKESFSCLNEAWFARFDVKAFPVVGPRAAAVMRLTAILAPAVASIASRDTAASGVNRACRALAAATGSYLASRAVESALTTNDEEFEQDSLLWWYGGRFRQYQAVLECVAHVVSALALLACEQVALCSLPSVTPTFIGPLCGWAAGLALLRAVGVPPRGWPSVVACLAGCPLDDSLRLFTATFFAGLALSQPARSREALLAASSVVRLVGYASSTLEGPIVFVGAATVAATAIVGSRSMLGFVISTFVWTKLHTSRPLVVAASIIRFLIALNKGSWKSACIGCTALGDLIASSPTSMVATGAALAAAFAPTVLWNERLLKLGGQTRPQTQYVIELISSGCAALFLFSPAGAIGVQLDVSRTRRLALAVGTWGAIAQVSESPPDGAVWAMGGAAAAFVSDSAALAFAGAAAVAAAFGFEWRASGLAGVAVLCQFGLLSFIELTPAFVALASARANALNAWLSSLWVSTSCVALFAGSTIVCSAASVVATATAFTVAATSDRLLDSPLADPDALRIARFNAFLADMASVMAASLLAVAFSAVPEVAALVAPLPLFLLTNRHATLLSRSSSLANNSVRYYLRQDALRRIAPFLLAAAALALLAYHATLDAIDVAALLLCALPSHLAAWFKLASMPLPRPFWFTDPVFAVSIWPLAFAPFVLCRTMPAKLFGIQAAVSSAISHLDQSKLNFL